MPPSQNAWTKRKLQSQCAWGSAGVSTNAPLRQVLDQPIGTLGDLEDKLAVKNTFIDVCLRDFDGSTIVQRRTLSVPPSFRSATSATASTVASSDFSDLCSEASDGYAPTFDSDWDCSPEEQAVIQVSLQAFIPATAPTQSAARLSSHAKPWCPSGRTDTVPLAQLTQLSGQFAIALEPAVRIVSIVASKMGQVYSSQVAVSQQTDGWSIVAMLKTEDSWQVKTLLEAAQAALIGTSDTSQRILVISCKPLASSEYGFRAMLGIVDDASKACWDVCSAKGCPRGSRCYWEHPRLVRRLDVGIHFQQLQSVKVAVPPE